MTYDLPSDIAQQVQAHIATGEYVSPEEVLRDAMAALADRRDSRAAIQAGIEDMEAGRVRPLDEVDSELRAKYKIPRSK